MLGFVVSLNKQITWTMNYYSGQENPDATPTTNCPPVPVQPGLCFVPVVPAPKGRVHIFDSYVNWQATPRWTFAVEGDYVVQRIWATSDRDETLLRRTLGRSRLCPVSVINESVPGGPKLVPVR